MPITATDPGSEPLPDLDAEAVWVELEGAPSGIRVVDLTRILSGPFA